MDASDGGLSRTRTTRSELEALLDGSHPGVREELRALKLGGLSRRCRQSGISDEELEELQDQDEPKIALIRWIVAHEADPMEEVRKKLLELKLGALSRRAVAAGVSEESLQEAQDSDEPRAAVVALILKLGVAAAEQCVAAPPTPRPSSLSATPPPEVTRGPPHAAEPEEEAPAPSPASVPHEAPAPFSTPAGIQLWVKTSSGTVSIVAEDGTATTVSQIRKAIALKTGSDIGECRLIFAGRELEDALTLADYDCEAASELNLLLRGSRLAQAVAEDASVDPEAEEATALLRAMMRGKKLSDFSGFRKVGGKDIQAVGGGGYSQSGVCSYVYLAKVRGGDGMQLALKVMLNYQTADNTLALNHEFDAETALLSDPVRLPPHRHVMAVLHSFVDDATALPGWEFDPSLVMSRTMMVVMPFFPKDLKAAVRSARRRGPGFGNARAARIVYHLLLAVCHLKSHGIVHRDIKLDNVLLANVDTDDEAAILTDFGCSFDMRKNRVHDWKVEMKFDGFRRGGAPIALAPEVTLPKPGPDALLDYSRNDEWAVGMVAHELFSPEDAGPFADMEHPVTYSDDSYNDEGIVEHCKPLVRSLLRVAVADRLGAAEASRKARQLLSHCLLKEILASTASEYQSGALMKIDSVLKHCESDGTAALSQDVVVEKQSLEARRESYVADATIVLQDAVSGFSIRAVLSVLDKFVEDKSFVLAAWAALDQHRVALEKKMKRQLASAIAEGEEAELEVALAAAADFGDSVFEERQTALAALSQARASAAAEAAVARGEQLLASDKFAQAIKAFKEAVKKAAETNDGPLQARVKERLNVAERKAKAHAKSRDQPRPVTAEALGRALRDAISVGVPLWNSGDYAGCAAEYLRVVSEFQHADHSLAQAVRDCEGQSTGSARDSQGWILRRAMDECLQQIRAGTWQPSPPALKIVLLCSDFADHRADVQKHLARGLGLPTVPTIDLHESTPSSATLAQYDVALVFTASWGASMMRGFPPTSYQRSAVGDRLADFVDGGGNVVMMYCNPPPEGRWERENYCPMRWEGIKEAKPRQRASGGPLGSDALGPLWAVSGRVTANAQVISSWDGIGPFLALSRPSGRGFTCLLNYFPPSNACSAHRVQDRLWDPHAMDGGKLMAQAVFLVQRVSHETDHEGSAEASDDEDDLRAALSEYIESWKHAGEHIQEAISNGAEVFNAGHADECYKCYSSVASAILTRRSSWAGTTLYKILADAVSQSAAEDGENASAWTMRGAFDAVLDALGMGDDTLLMLAVEEAAEIRAESSADSQRRQSFQKTADNQQRIGDADGQIEPGTKLWVAQQPGKGVGTYVSFERKLMGPNLHTIRFDEPGVTKAIKLSEVHWLVLSAPGE